MTAALMVPQLKKRIKNRKRKGTLTAADEVAEATDVAALAALGAVVARKVASTAAVTSALTVPQLKQRIKNRKRKTTWTAADDAANATDAAAIVARKALDVTNVTKRL